MLLMDNFAYRIQNDAEKSVETTKTLAHGYSSESTQRELSNEYQHDKFYMFFTNLWVLVL